jgi:hypothetical protein
LGFELSDYQRKSTLSEPVTNFGRWCIGHLARKARAAFRAQNSIVQIGDRAQQQNAASRVVFARSKIRTSKAPAIYQASLDASYSFETAKKKVSWYHLLSVITPKRGNQPQQPQQQQPQ